MESLQFSKPPLCCIIHYERRVSSHHIGRNSEWHLRWGKLTLITLLVVSAWAALNETIDIQNTAQNIINYPDIFWSIHVPVALKANPDIQFVSYSHVTLSHLSIFEFKLFLSSKTGFWSSALSGLLQTSHTFQIPPPKYLFCLEPPTLAPSSWSKSFSSELWSTLPLSWAISQVHLGCNVN